MSFLLRALMRETGGEREGGRKFEVERHSKEILRYTRRQYNMDGQNSTEILVLCFRVTKNTAFSSVVLYGAIFNLAAPSSSSSSASLSAAASVRRGGWRGGKMR